AGGQVDEIEVEVAGAVIGPDDAAAGDARQHLVGGRGGELARGLGAHVVGEDLVGAGDALHPHHGVAVDVGGDLVVGAGGDREGRPAGDGEPHDVGVAAGVVLVDHQVRRHARVRLHRRVVGDEPDRPGQDV